MGMDFGKLIALANDLGPIVGDVQAAIASPQGQQILALIEADLSNFIAHINSVPIAPATPVVAATAPEVSMTPDGGLPATPSL